MPASRSRELVVYSYRACQNEYQQQSPSRRQVARAVGMGRDAVARADRELMRDRAPRLQPHPAGTARGMVPEEEEDGPRQALATRVYLVDEVRPADRTAGCPCSRSAAGATSPTAPRPDGLPENGLGASYLCRVLRANRTSVQKVLATLKDSGLVQRHDGSWCPVLVDLDWLADKWDGQKSEGGTPKVRWVELPEGATVTIPTDGLDVRRPARARAAPQCSRQRTLRPLDDATRRIHAWKNGRPS